MARKRFTPEQIIGMLRLFFDTCEVLRKPKPASLLDRCLKTG